MKTVIATALVALSIVATGTVSASADPLTVGGYLNGNVYGR
jgi:hypothetical protein